jgi:hypothetical protein
MPFKSDVVQLNKNNGELMTPFGWVAQPVKNSFRASPFGVII